MGQKDIDVVGGVIVAKDLSTHAGRTLATTGLAARLAVAVIDFAARA